MAEFIETWYNVERRHSSLGYVRPAQYQEQLRQSVARAAYTPCPSKWASSNLYKDPETGLPLYQHDLLPRQTSFTPDAAAYYPYKGTEFYQVTHGPPMRRSVTIASCILIAAACVAAASSTPKPPSPGQPPIAALVDAVLEFRQRPDKAAPRLDACALGRFVGGADPAPFLSPIRRSSLLGTWTKDCDPAYSPRPREDNVQFLIRTEGPDTTVRLPEGRGPSYRVTIEVRNSTEIYNEVFLLREFATTIGGTPRMRVYGYSWALDLSSDALAP